MLLKSAFVAVDRELTVPEADLHEVVEVILIQNDFVLSVNNDTPPYMLTIQSLNSSARRDMRQGARYVPAEELAAWSDHPAHLIRTVIDLPHMDVRTLTNSLRSFRSEPIPARLDVARRRGSTTRGRGRRGAEASA